MNIRVCEYNENIVALRIAHLDFYLSQDGYVIAPFTKGEVGFAKMIADELGNVQNLRQTLKNEQEQRRIDLVFMDAHDKIDAKNKETLEVYRKIINYALTMDHHSAHDIAELEYLAKKAGLEGK